MRKRLAILISLTLLAIIFSLYSKKSHDVFEQNLYDQFDRCGKSTTYEEWKGCFVDLITGYFTKDPAMMPQVYAALIEYTDDERTNLNYVRLHSIFHDVGMILYYKIDNPKEAYLLCNDAEVDLGCHISVIMGYADEKKAAAYDPINLIEEVCYTDTPETPTLLRPAACMHSIGHVSIYKRYGDIQKALDDCDRIPEEYREECYRGLFMEYSKGDSHLGVHSHNQLGTISLPCEDIPVKYRSACYRISGSGSPAFSGGRGNFAEAVKLCNQAGNFRFDCYKGITTRLIRTYKKDLQKAKIACDSLVDESASLCSQAILYNIKAYPERYVRSSDRLEICFHLDPYLAEKCHLANLEYLKFIYGLH